jgi:hypothetical protein
VTVVNGFAAIGTHPRVVSAFMFARHNILAFLTVEFALANLDALVTVIADAIG